MLYFTTYLNKKKVGLPVIELNKFQIREFFHKNVNLVTAKFINRINNFQIINKKQNVRRSHDRYFIPVFLRLFALTIYNLYTSKHSTLLFLVYI